MIFVNSESDKGFQLRVEVDTIKEGLNKLGSDSAIPAPQNL